MRKRWQRGLYTRVYYDRNMWDVISRIIGRKRLGVQNVCYYYYYISGKIQESQKPKKDPKHSLLAMHLLHFIFI